MIALTADVGGSRIKLGVVRDGVVAARRELAARPAEGLRAHLPAMAVSWRDACRELDIGMNACLGVGIAFPGLIEPRSARILSTPRDKYEDARELDLVAWANAEFGLPVALSVDANAALAGEWRAGAARGFSSVVMMTLGTGIGTSVIVDGVPLRGQHGQAGALGGHLTIQLDGAPCGCGNVGCAEAEASTWALARHARADGRFAASSLAAEPVLDYEAISRRARQGDALAVDLVRRAWGVWSALAVSLVHAYDPELIVVGGGIARGDEALIEALQESVDRHAWAPWGRVQVCTAALGDDAALVGMAALLEDRIGTRHEHV